MKSKDKYIVLLVEDEKTLSSIISDTLENEGFSTLQAFDGQNGLKLFFEERPDIIIADVMMPVLDGFEMIRRIRLTDKTTPVLFLTARSSIEDLVSGFELGANDYIRKPFKMQELIIRVKALLNRIIIINDTRSVFKIGNYVFDSIAQTLTLESDSKELSFFENEILKRLCSNLNQVVDIKELLRDLWHDDSSYNRNSLHGYIHKLRRLLIKDDQLKFINVRGIGYKLVYKQSIGNELREDVQ